MNACCPSPSAYYPTVKMEALLCFEESKGAGGYLIPPTLLQNTSGGRSADPQESWGWGGGQTPTSGGQLCGPGEGCQPHEALLAGLQTGERTPALCLAVHSRGAGGGGRPVHQQNLQRRERWHCHGFPGMW